MRHARYVFSAEAFQRIGGPEPSPEGVRETKVFAAVLSDRRFAAVYANGSTRSLMTARIMARGNAHDPSMIIDRRFDPLKADFFGADMVRHMTDPAARFQTGIRWLDGSLPSLEPVGIFMARVSSFLFDLAERQQHDETDVLVVGHWETVAAARAAFLGLSAREAILQTEGACAHGTLYAFHPDAGQGWKESDGPG